MTQLPIYSAGKTDVGRVREVNEDNLFVAGPQYDEALYQQRGRIFIAADGVGGNRGGSTASKLACELIPSYYYASQQPEIPARLREAINLADSEIRQKSRQDPNLREMSCTIAVVVILEGACYIAHIGDARVYHARTGDQLRQLTKDHSWVQEQVDKGVLTPEEAENHPNRNVITRSLGGGDVHQPDVQGPLRLRAGDRLLLCSDGLSGPVGDEELHRWVNRPQQNGDTNQFLQQMVGKLIVRANENGGYDNITAIVVQVGKPLPATVAGGKAISTTKSESRIPSWGVWAMAGGVLLLVVLALAFLFGGGDPTVNVTPPVVTNGTVSGETPITPTESPVVDPLTGEVQPTSTIGVTTVEPEADPEPETGTTPTNNNGGSLVNPPAVATAPAPSPVPTGRQITLTTLSCSASPISTFVPDVPIEFKWQIIPNTALAEGEYLELRIGARGADVLSSKGQVNAIPPSEGFELQPSVRALVNGVEGEYEWQIAHMAADRIQQLALSPRGCFNVQATPDIVATLPPAPQTPTEPPPPPITTPPSPTPSGPGGGQLTTTPYP